MEDATKESDGARVTGKTTNSVELWMRRSSLWYVAREKCSKCSSVHVRVYRAGKTDKLICSYSVANAEGVKRACGSKTFTEVSREYTGVDSSLWCNFDRIFNERFTIKEDITTEGLERWAKKFRLKVAGWVEQAKIDMA